MTLPLELEFLQEYIENRSDLYTYAEWLLSNFPEPVWTYDFDFKKGPQELDWRVRLNDGSFLTDSKNSQFLNSLKYWLIASTQPQRTGFANSVKVQYAEFNRTLHLIDYLILNDSYLKVSVYGLAALSEDDLKYILSRVASCPTVAESLFSWSSRLKEFAQSLLDQTDIEDIEKTLTLVDGICVVSPEDEAEALAIGIEPTSLPHLRAALYIHGYIATNKRLGFSPNSKSISERIYKNTIRVKSIDKPALSLFSFSPSQEPYRREYDAVQVTTGEKETSLSPVVYSRYVSSLYRMGVLHEMKRNAPDIEALLSIRNFEVELKQMGRYRTLPSQIVFDSVRNAIEFHFDHGREILDAFLRLALACKRLDKNMGNLSKDEFKQAIGPRLQALGVTELGIVTTNYGSLGVSKTEYFDSLRSNQKLLPLINVYFGAVQLVVGVLVVRRVGELIDLEVGKALDKAGRWLVFQNRKSTQGLMGLRSTTARPIDPIGTKMLREIDRFQKILNRIGFGKPVQLLFSSPTSGKSGSCYRNAASPFSFAKHLDYFCDYFETPLNDDGKRYYIRQHQLRRFFALLFFYSNSFGSLETLQWMLGHTDLRHVWHYITESMSGEVLRGAKSQYVAESLHHGGGEAFRDLAALLEKKYGTKDFTLLDTEELEVYLSELLEEGKIEVEPEFFEDPEGEKFKVIVTIKELGGSEQ